MGFSLEELFKTLNLVLWDETYRDSEIVDRLKTIVRKEEIYARQCGQIPVDPTP